MPRVTLGTSTRASTTDSLFLALVVTLSCLSYLRGLGFYSDDWSFLATLQHAPDTSFAGLYRSLLPHGLGTRPLQAVLFAGLYSIFGLEPLGYHIVNAVVFVATVVLFHLALRELAVPRPLALAVPLVFAMLPHYSTDRFWVAAFQANLSLGLYMLSLYADLRFAVGAGASRWGWKATGTAALLGSVLAYEMAAPLIVVNLLLVWLRARTVRRAAADWRPLQTGLVLGINLVALVGAVIYKAASTQRAALGDGRLGRFMTTLGSAAEVHFGEYGWGLPAKVGRVLRDYPDPLVLGVSLVVGLVVLGYLGHMLRSNATPFPTGTGWLVGLVAGAIVFAAGYGVSLMAAEIGFHPTGVVNRTAIAAALGTALVFVALLGWASALLPSDRLRRASFSALVASLAAVACLLTDTIATFWVAAAREQKTVIEAVRRRFPTLPPGTTLLLDGVCRYIGPGVVFETSWDVRGMLQVVYDDASLRGNVVRPGLAVRDEGLRLTFWGGMISVHAYGDHLLVYDVRSDAVTALPSVAAAREYFGSRPTAAQRDCPAGVEGSGVEIF